MEQSASLKENRNLYKTFNSEHFFRGKLVKKIILALSLTAFFAACGDSSSASANGDERGSLIDERDGHVYKTVVIGTQTWMAENLNYQSANSYCYDNDPLYCAKYGRLYTWTAAIDRTEDECGVNKKCDLGVGIVQGVCPSGWHLPSAFEWNNLFSVVGDSSTAGKKLKSQEGWRYNGHNGNGTDDYGFSVLPAGEGYGNHYGGEAFLAEFWSSTEDSEVRAYRVYLTIEYDDVRLVLDKKIEGKSVRCVKD
ncbi:MAG: fibrobacter succinogenes major paralogous domain-containing protein [Fibrobacter sp.]|nr:fibrobacter succinogenes major paralogous domain-containing protein [Fibrobacter sp.]